MKSLFPSFTQPPAQPNGANALHHYHRVELILPKSEFPPDQIRSQTLIDRIRNIISDLLIILGSLLALAAGTAVTLQSAGITSPAIPVLANFLMPAVAAILTGFHLSKNDFRTAPQFRIPTGIPGLTIGS